MSELLAAILEFLIDVVVQVLFEIAIEGGAEAVGNAIAFLQDSRRPLAAVGHVLLGLFGGAVSLVVVPRRLFAPSFIPGLSLLFAPLGTGAILHLAGNWWQYRGWDRPAFLTFRAGVLFAFAFEAVRFIYFQGYWLAILRVLGLS